MVYTVQCFGGSYIVSVVKETELPVESLGSMLLSAVGLATLRLRDRVLSTPAANQRH